MTITQAELKAKFDYRDDGQLVRKVSVMGPSGRIGSTIGFVLRDTTRPDKQGYLATKIHGHHYCVHKLIWLWHYGEIPDQLDHINRDSLDNRIENLRPATASQNTMNRKLFSNNRSGCRGVSWNKRQNKWFAYVDVNKRRKNLGYFQDLELADLVATEARDLYHGEFANVS
jgi:hypothetical protein